MEQTYAGQRLAIAGFGAEGRAAYDYFAARGAHLTILDHQPVINCPEGVACQTGPEAFTALDRFDLIIRTPSLRPDMLVGANVVTSVTREFLRVCPAPVVGVTGTKGKGTTTTLIANILHGASIKTHVVGNIGEAALKVINEIKADDVVVYEMSSFQLWDVEQSPQVAVVLMIDEDHQDIHNSMEEYVRAKGNICAFQKKEDLVVYHPTNSYSAAIAELSPAQRHIKYQTEAGAHILNESVMIDGQTICGVDEVGLVGPHNLENICAAITAAWEFTQDTAAIAQALRDFKGLEHRLELVRELDGVRYYNDSFAAAAPAAEAAARSFTEPTIMILGGSDKGVTYTKLAHTLKEVGVKQALLIGQTRSQMADAMRAEGFRNFTILDDGVTMPDIVAKAHELAERGDVVVLSPGCASFDMFENYKQRGQLFKEAVQAL